jgi:CRISPR system Cascade subunit CasE
MYLSTIQLNPHHALARRDLRDAYEMYRTLNSAFSDLQDAPFRRFLWRMEQPIETDTAGVVVVQSHTPADWSILEKQPGYAQEIEGNRHIDLDHLLEPARCYHFRLQVNPTVTRDGKRFGLRTKQEQVDWLTAQGKKHGFEVMAYIRESSQRLQLRQGKSGNKITVHTVLFDGFLQAKNPQLLQKAICSGLGHGRSWGLGLLTVEPLS